MDVQSSSQKKITRIHTFESDVALARKVQGVTTPVVPVAVPNVRVEAYIPPAPKIPRVAPQSPAPVTPVQAKQYSMISKEIAGIAVTQAPSILSDKTDPYDSETLGGGTIIRDTKRKRFKLFPAMLSAITSWFSHTKQAYEESRVPLHTVAKAEKRIETIGKAVAQSEQAPKDDFKKVSEHLKTLERKPIHSTLLFKDKDSVPKPEWASASGEAQIGEEIAPVLEPVPVREPEIISEVAQEMPEPVTYTEEPVEQLPEEPAEIVLTETYDQNVETISEPEEVQYVEEVQAPIEQTSIQGDMPQRRYAPPRTDKSLFPFYALISVILVASLSGIAFSYYLFAGKNSTVTRVQTPVYEVPKLIQAQNKTSFVLPQDRTEFLEILLSKLEESNTVTQMYPTITENGDRNKPAPAEAIVAVLAPRAQGSFTRAIKEITFGSDGNAEPFIIIKATSFDVAFAGMLNWEKMMSADLTPLFGETVTETFDPQARTATGAREAFFKDVIASNKNARVLLDENGDDRIVYTFADQNTVLITTTRDALAELIGLVK